MEKSIPKIIHRLAEGFPPPPSLAGRLLVGFDRLMEDWRGELTGYIAQGGSLIRIVSGPSGCGKTHLASALQAQAADLGYLVCQIDAQGEVGSDDLSLYRAFCAGLTSPDGRITAENPDRGLLATLFSAQKRLSDGNLASKIRNLSLPVPTLGESIVTISHYFKQHAANDLASSRSEADGIALLSTLLSGEAVAGTKSLSKIKKLHPYPILAKLTRIPGKRDARLWLESLLAILPPLGFKGVLLILDEQESSSKRQLDLHIVQLRRLLDKLTEGHLPGVFVVYFVLDTFANRVREVHGALHQRIAPILKDTIPNRIFSRLEDLRDLSGQEFLPAIARRIYSLINPVGPLPSELQKLCLKDAEQCLSHGLVHTRQFVKRFAERLQESLE